MTDNVETWVNEVAKMVARNPEYYMAGIPDEYHSFLWQLSIFVQEMDARGLPYTLFTRTESQ